MNNKKYTGDIWLKKVPTRICTEETPDFDKLEIVSDLDSLKESIPEPDFGTIDGCFSFWQAYGDENGVDLLERALIRSDRLILHFDNPEDMKKDFISFTEFLAKAKFIGRKWRIPGNGPEAEFINSLGDRTVLFGYDNVFLIHNNHSQFGPIFELMIRDPESVEQDECLCEVSETAQEFRDKASTYCKVLGFISRSKNMGL